MRHRKRLGKVIECPLPHALHDGLDRAVCGNHHHKRLVVIVGEALDENPPIAIGQFHVEEDEVKRIGHEAFFGLCNRPRRGNGIPLAPQSLLKGFANNRGVINNQYAVKSHQVLAEEQRYMRALMLPEDLRHSSLPHHKLDTAW